MEHLSYQSSTFTASSSYKNVISTCNYTTNARKNLPPFGVALMESLSLGKIPNNDIYLFVGNKAWQKSKNLQQ